MLVVGGLLRTLARLVDVSVGLSVVQVSDWRGTEAGGDASLVSARHVPRPPMGGGTVGRSGPRFQVVKEPLVDVFDEGGKYRVCVDFPGAERESIALQAIGDVVRLSARGAHGLRAEVLLPSPVAAVNDGDAAWSYRNGIIEAWFRKEASDEALDAEAAGVAPGADGEPVGAKEANAKPTQRGDPTRVGTCRFASSPPAD